MARTDGLRIFAQAIFHIGSIPASPPHDKHTLQTGDSPFILLAELLAPLNSQTACLFSSFPPLDSSDYVLALK